jgi:hypothetical protein
MSMKKILNLSLDLELTISLNMVVKRDK